jgi:hypothetical protein
MNDAQHAAPVHHEKIDSKRVAAILSVNCATTVTKERV